MLPFATAALSAGWLTVAVERLAEAGPAEASSVIAEDWYFSDQFLVRRLEGQRAPELNVARWVGEPQTLENLRGRIVVIDLWASWCAPCLVALNEDAKIVQKYATRGVTLIGIHDSVRGWEKAEKTVAEREIRYSVGLDSSSEKDNTRARFHLEAWPTYVVIDRKGVVRAAGLRPEKVADLLELLLKEPEGQVDSRVGRFAPDVYLGGATRPTAVRAMEGRVVPALTVREWLGSAQSPLLSGGVATVVLFWSPTNKYAMREFEQLRTAEPELVKLGVRVIALCDQRADWPEVMKMAAKKGWTTALAQDDIPQGISSTDVPRAVPGATTEAFGVPSFPTTIVVDSNAVVRAAGVRAARVREVVDKIVSGDK
jgi:thiol-disulfide isomerase/thioredoxin